MLTLLNSFAAGMLPVGSAKVQFADMDLAQARELVRVMPHQSAVGHADTAALMADLLGVPVPANRVSVSVPGPRIYGMPAWHGLICQYSGPRLPEGTKTLPEGASIRWIGVYID